MTNLPMNHVLLAPAILVGADLEAWLANGSGVGLRAAIEQPDTVIDTIEAADLRGRGGAGFPTHSKWRFVADRIDTGTAAPGDLDHQESLCDVLPGSGRCGLVDGAATVVRSSLDRYGGEYDAALGR